MYQLHFTLKQHTPIIHFQWNQDGATLRASEVKPKLDRFIIEQLGKEANSSLTDYEEIYKAGLKKAHQKGWLIDKEGKKGALDYKIKIESNDNKENRILNRHANSPMYFGNMGNKPEEKEKFKHFKITNDDINCCIHTSNFNLDIKKNLLSEIEPRLSDFFYLNNFGTRQSKGYGSFSLIKTTFNNSEKKYSLTTNLYNYCFDIDIDIKPIENGDFKELFEKIDWFYRSIRSGININNQLYFKSSLFMYLNNKGIQWDKKTIKAHYLNYDDFTFDEAKKDRRGIWSNENETIEYYNSQNTKHKQPDILNNPTIQSEELELKLWRDLLGLSSDESWYSYRATINKSEPYLESRTNIWKAKMKDKKIERLKSPIQFKLIKIGNKMKIYFAVKEFVFQKLLGQKMLVSIKHNKIKQFNRIENGKPKFDYQNLLSSKDNSDLILPFPEDFNFYDYLNWVFKNINPTTHTKINENLNEEKKKEMERIKNSLSNIYSQLKKQIPND